MIPLHVYKKEKYSVNYSDHTYTINRDDIHYGNHGYTYLGIECYVPISSSAPVYYYSKNQYTFPYGYLLRYYYSRDKYNSIEDYPYGGLSFYVLP